MAIRRTSNPIPLVYIAGPFAGPTNYDVQQNVNEAEALGLRVAYAGALPVIVHTMNRNFYGQLTETFWLAGVMELLRRCDAIMLSSRWESSNGAKAEYGLARTLQIPIFYAYDDRDVFDRWVAAWKANRTEKVST